MEMYCSDRIPVPVLVLIFFPILKISKFDLGGLRDVK